MDEILNTKEIDEYLEAGAGLIVEMNIVAIPSGNGVWGFYQKQNESRWDLKMTSLSLDGFRGE